MTLNIDTEFEKATKDVQFLLKKPSDSDLLKLYGLYKQSLFGSNKDPKPSFFDFKSKSKWEAWNNVKTLSKNMAKKEYIKLVDEFKLYYGFNSNNL